MWYRFDQFQLDAARHELWQGEKRIDLQPKVLDVLLFLLENPERTLTKDEILEAVWPGVATTEDSLVRCVSLLRKELMPRGRPELIRTVRGRGYAMAVRVESDEGRLDGAVAPADAIAPRRRWRLVAAAAALLLAVAWLLFRSPPPPTPGAALPEPRGLAVAVLPLLDRSPGGDPGHLADGMTLALSEHLDALPEVHLLSTRTSFEIADEADAIAEARALGVDLIATGTLRREGGRIELRLELTDAATGLERWKEFFSYTDAEHLRMQPEVASLLAAQLDDSPPRPAATPVRLPRSLTAYESYLRGLRAAQEVAREEQQIAIAAYERAIELDPDYADAYTALGLAYAELWSLVETDGAASGLLTTAEAAVRRALELSPDDGASRVALGSIQIQARRWGVAEQSFRQALERADSADARRLYANLLMALARLDEAGPHIARMLELEPLSARNQRAAGRYHFYQGDYERAIPHLEKSLELDPHQSFASRLLGTSHFYLGNDAAALEALLLRAPGWARGPMRAWERIAGQGAALRAALQVEAALTGDPCRDDPQGTAIALAHLEEADAMYACLERAAARHLWYVQVEPAFSPYRDSARFSAVLARGGFPPRAEPSPGSATGEPPGVVSPAGG